MPSSCGLALTVSPPPRADLQNALSLSRRVVSMPNPIRYRVLKSQPGREGIRAESVEPVGLYAHGSIRSNTVHAGTNI